MFVSLNHLRPIPGKRAEKFRVLLGRQNWGRELADVGGRDVYQGTTTTNMYLLSQSRGVYIWGKDTKSLDPQPWNPGRLLGRDRGSSRGAWG